jgi:hypothetical protein
MFEVVVKIKLKKTSNSIMSIKASDSEKFLGIKTFLLLQR